MTEKGTIEPIDIIETIKGISSGEKESYAILQGDQALSLLPVIGSTIESLALNASMITEPVVKSYLLETQKRLSSLNSSIQTQLVRNAQFKSKKAIA